jgi:hypothetical protein
MDPGTELAAVQPDPRLTFRLERRTVVGYICMDCLMRGAHKDDCRSPEWEYDGGVEYRQSVPDEVMDWVNRHGRQHAFWGGR